MNVVSLWSAKISWTAPATGGAVTQYNVKFGRASGVYTTTYILTGSPPATSVPLLNANSGTGEWFAVITAENAAGESAPSNEYKYWADSGGAVMLHA